MRSFSRRVSLWMGVLVLLAGFSPVASAQELEPNNSCLSAQDGGTIVLPASVAGSLDGAFSFPTDVDFYRFTAAPGLAVTVTTGFGQRVGLFSDQCVLQAASDPFSDRRLDLTVPASGSFILAVAERFDSGFNGFGSFNSGAYTISFNPQPPKIGSISGRLVDAVARTPLQGAVAPFASVELRRCTSGNCFDFVNRQSADAAGMFRFELDSRGRRIEVGDFMLIASADEFQPATLLFSVLADQNQQIGDVALVPPPILFSNIRPCTAILPQGGTCQYSVSIRNNTTAKFTGQALSIVDGGFGATRFEASTRASGAEVRRAAVSVPKLGKVDVTFFFTVPSFVANGTMICTQLQLGLDPTPLFNVMRRKDLFCMAKGSSGFQVMSAGESRAVFEMMSSPDAPPAQSLK